MFVCHLGLFHTVWGNTMKRREVERGRTTQPGEEKAQGGLAHVCEWIDLP